MFSTPARALRRFDARVTTACAAAAAALLLVLSGADLRAAIALPFPNEPDSVKFAVIGDNGTGDTAQYRVADQMVAARAAFPFEFVLMLGDNMYGKQDFVKKFEAPYRLLLDAGVTFHAAIGNHDSPVQMNYPKFNMGGRRWYTFERRGLVRFFALDYESPGREQQLPWLEQELAAAREPWKIVYLHHPLYSSGKRHGPDIVLRRMLEPILVQHGVQVVWSGHEHFYQRIHPQKGVHYFISGAGGKLRKNGVEAHSQNAASFDTDQHFMVVEIDGDDLHFAAISRAGAIVDAGVIRRTPAPVPTSALR